MAKWVNGGMHTHSLTLTHTHTQTRRLFGLSVLPVGMVGKEKITKKKIIKYKSNFQLTSENMGHTFTDTQTSKKGTAETRLLEK